MEDEEEEVEVKPAKPAKSAKKTKSQGPGQGPGQTKNPCIESLLNCIDHHQSNFTEVRSQWVRTLHEK